MLVVQGGFCGRVRWVRVWAGGGEGERWVGEGGVGVWWGRPWLGGGLAKGYNYISSLIF